jgi:hypothetical protein
MGNEVFEYSNRSLQKVIVDQMEQNEWVGVCCEPNAVFVVCNQFPVYVSFAARVETLLMALIDHSNALQRRP